MKSCYFVPVPLEQREYLEAQARIRELGHDPEARRIASELMNYRELNVSQASWLDGFIRFGPPREDDGERED